MNSLSEWDLMLAERGRTRQLWAEKRSVLPSSLIATSEGQMYRAIRRKIGLTLHDTIPDALGMQWMSLDATNGRKELSEALHAGRAVIGAKLIEGDASISIPFLAQISQMAQSMFFGQSH